MQIKNILLFVLILFCIGLTELQSQTVKDVDGNVYKTVIIGTQFWMAENLRTTRYKDSTSIPLVTDNKAWKALTTPAYCWYNNNETANKNTNGALYNWYTVYTNKLCPMGWHIPKDVEWQTLTTYLGGENIAGGKLKEIGTTHWISPNTGATNETGFTALPGGSHYDYGAFGHSGYFGYWWSATEYSASDANLRYICYIFRGLYGNHYNKQYGFSVRCIKDN
jgi:uncharacterized protein (TIGR02145 family)